MKQHLFEYRLFSAIFDTQQNKEDVKDDLIVTSLWIFTAFERFCLENFHAKFGDNWTTNNGETEPI